MGVMNHNAVIATTWSDKKAAALRSWIAGLEYKERDLFSETESWTNGYFTFFLAPDGSKEGWPESATGDELRDRLVAKLAEDEDDDGYSSWKWIEVGFGEFGQKVLRGNCKNCYNDAEYAWEES
jgi:hypothetical protein